jgi:very-short-patch-repair endonuclease
VRTEDGTISTPEHDVSRDRAIRLFTFLRRLAELRTRTIRTLDEYEQVLWFHSIPQEHGCYCIAWRPADTAQTEVWVEIQKPRLQAPPTLPKILEPWVLAQHVTDSSQDVPEIQERVPASEAVEQSDRGSAPGETLIWQLADFPDVHATWEKYVTEDWWPWAERDRVLQQIQHCYTSLYSLYQQQQRLGEAYEVVLGLGYLTWRTPSAQTVKRHLLVAQTSIHFDAVKGKISVGPGAEGAKLVLEEDMLEASEAPDPNESKVVSQLIEDTGDAIWADGGVSTILQAWLNAFPKGKGYENSLILQDTILSDPQVHLAPALILRRRTERSFVRVFKEICEQLSHPDNPIPDGVRDIVDDPDKTRPAYGYPDDAPESSALTDTEIYFPLAANLEQIEIARQVTAKRGVLVQGPPGTGKSHTIANLVCHLLASGKRVLVTSHTPRALKVLRGKFPKEIAPLCVIALGEDSRSVAALEESVHGIAARFGNWRRAESDQRVVKCRESLDHARQQEAKHFLDLRSIREAETLRHPPRFGDYKGTLQQIAKRLRHEESRYAWVGTVTDETQPPPLQNDEALELLALIREIDQDTEDELNLTTIDTKTELPTPDALAVLIEQEKDARKLYDESANAREYPAYRQLSEANIDDRSLLISSLKVLCSVFQDITRDLQPWIREAASHILAGQCKSWLGLHELTLQHLREISDKAVRVSELSVSGIKTREQIILKAHALSLHKHLKGGGKLGFLTLRPKPVKDALYLIKDVRVDGRLCNAIQPLAALIDWLSVREHLDSLDKHWKPILAPSSGHTIVLQKAVYEDLAAKLGTCLELRDLLEKAKAAVHAIADLPEPAWHDISTVTQLEAAARAARDEGRLRRAEAEINAIATSLCDASRKPEAHPILTVLTEAVRNRDVESYRDGYQKLIKLAKIRAKRDRRDILLSCLSARTRELSNTLAETHADPAWDERCTSFCDAWNWARADLWTKRMADPLEQQRLTRAIDAERAKIQSIIAELASELAWQYCHSRLTQETVGHLKAWQVAIQKGGKWTGKYANTFRRQAQEHLEKCRSAIPAWIMPLYRVVETVKINPDIFDVIIIDEASQSGPEALLLHYIAKNIIVVGDEKQISPQFVGMSRQEVILLRSQHIADLPFNDSIGIENSFFHHAYVRYQGHIRLREHFRCMPEIIQFSNNLCYSTAPLIPLKQFGAGRLSPTVHSFFVGSGYQKGQSPRVTNPPEAQAIAESIKKNCSDPMYAGKSMGIISLLGEEQAKLIQSLLFDKIGPEEMEKRGIVCGDAYAFQGDERDVMFLSLVSAPGEGHRIGTLSGGAYEQRFNVAASRAREQMILFHSAMLSDLSPVCLRYKLLDYCQHPALQQGSIEDASVEQLRTRTTEARRDLEQPPHPFESWFELDVFLRIVDRGFRVLPQLDVAGYRIDLVVEGMHGRLAVECDGDQWHGPERWEQDMARQRQLERSGYIFWRVRGSTFYRDPDDALNGLWGLLQRMRIFPNGVEEIQEISYNVSSSDTTLRGGEKGTLNSQIRSAPIGKVESRVAMDVGGDGGNGADIAEEESLDDALTLDEIEQSANAQLNHNAAGKNTEASTKIPVATDDEVGIEINALRGLMAEYRAWPPSSLPDPRTAPLKDVSKGLVEIVTIEGPILCYRAYRLYVAAAGIAKVGKLVRSALNQAMHKAVSYGVLQEVNEFGLRDQIHKVVRPSGSPSISLRKRGDRTIEEIPPTELAHLMDEAVRLNPALAHARPEDLFRLVLDAYELVRLTGNAQVALTRAWEIHSQRK